MSDVPAMDTPSNVKAAASDVHGYAFQHDVVRNLICRQARYPDIATPHDWYMALAYSVRDRMLARWAATIQTYAGRDLRAACYLSAEFLIGPQLGNNLVNLGIEDNARDAMRALGQDLDELLALEEEPGLGNGGLGRLAACYLDSLATLEIPSAGYGIRYEFGIFDQEIRDGWQVEVTDKWLRYGNPWEIRRPESVVRVGFGGHTEAGTGRDGKYRVHWIPDIIVNGVPYDTPVLGYGGHAANNLRLWASEAAESFQFERFNTGDYQGAVAEKVFSENITKVLYPNDEGVQGKQLRLEQQFFFVSCSLQDMIRVHLRQGRSLHTFHQKWTIQMNDTHPSIAVAELMRLLVDEHSMDWDPAWEI